jgi:hypothetical protein
MTHLARQLGPLALTAAVTWSVGGCVPTASAPNPRTPSPRATPSAATPAATPTPAAQAAPAATPAPPANPPDVESVDAILRALYDVISGPAGQRRNWDRMRSLFVPGARLIPTVRRQDGTRSHQVWTVDQYISTVGPRLEEMGFFERELARRTERYGNIVHAFSTYDSKRAASDPQPFARGINSIQLWNDGRRWWVVTVFWESERPDNPIPARYMQSEPAPPAR